VSAADDDDTLVPYPAGTRARFDYPEAFDTLPDYTAHAGQVVTVVRQLTDEEADVECQPMYEIEAADGWIGHAFDDELVVEG
jgi:hypothetical protein